jgi:RND family efflux transporter MFP subunit
VVEVRIESLKRNLKGTIARSARKVEANTRTMEVEVDLPNADLSIIPGTYASVILPVNVKPHTLAVPVQSVSRGKSDTVWLVDKEDRLQEKSIKIGLETPENLEVLEGLHEGDWVMVGNRASLKPGQKVTLKKTTMNAAE